MEQVESIPFSMLIAGLLLRKRSYTSFEVVQIICELEGMGIVVDDENDNFSLLFDCVDMRENYNFQLKEGLQYETILCYDTTVFDFLKMHTSEKILFLLEQYFNKKSLEIKIEKDITVIKNKKKSLIRDNFFKKSIHVIGGLF